MVDRVTVGAAFLALEDFVREGRRGATSPGAGADETAWHAGRLRIIARRAAALAEQARRAAEEAEEREGAGDE